jgi:ABC-type lipoprotein release transport system permease subunit
MLSFPYALKALFRNKKRSIQNIFGIFLAVSLISAVIFYNESAAIMYLNEALDDIEVDMSVSTIDLSSFGFGFELPELTANITDIDRWVENQSLVLASEYYFSLKSDIRVHVENGNEIKTSFAGIEEEYLQVFNVLTIIEGKFDITIDNETDHIPILIDDRNALKLGLSVNDTVNITKQSLDLEDLTGLFKNYTQSCRVGGIFRIEDTSSFLGLSLFNKKKGMVILPIWDLSKWQQLLFEKWRAHRLYGDINEQLHLKFDHSILPSNPDTAGGKTTAFSNQIMVKFGGQVYAQDNIGLSVLILRIILLVFQMLLLFLSIPAIILALYLQKYAIESSMEVRNIEIATLKSRGASYHQIISIMLSEILVIAIFTTLLGIICGSFLSQIMLWIPQFLIIETSLVAFDLSFSTLNYTNFLVILVIGLFMAILSTYLPIRRIVKEQDILEGMKEIFYQKKPFWKRVYLDVGLTILGLLFIAIQLIFEINIESGGILYAIFAAITPSLFWLGSILMLARIGSHLIMRAEGLIIRALSMIFSLGEVVAKSVTRRPENLSKAILILALTFSFGIMVSTTANTDHLTNNSQAQFICGSDLRINPILPVSTVEIEQVIHEADPNSVISTVFKDELTLGGTTIPVLGVDPKFKEVSFIPDHFFLDSSRNNAFTTLSLPNQSIISYDLAKDYDFQLGDTLGESSLEIGVYAYNFPLSTTEFIYGVEVTISASTGGSGEYFIITSHETFEDLFGMSNASYFLVKSSMKPEVIKTHLSDHYGPLLDIVTSNEILETLEKPGISNFNGVLSIEFLVVIVIACLGSGIFLLTITQQRKREIGTLFSLGATARQVTSFIAGEAITAAIFSVSAGSIIGFIISLLFRGFRTEPGSVASPVTFSLEGFVILLAFVIIGIVLAVFISLIEIKRTSVSEVLRTI